MLTKERREEKKEREVNGEGRPPHGGDKLVKMLADCLAFDEFGLVSLIELERKKERSKRSCVAFSSYRKCNFLIGKKLKKKKASHLTRHLSVIYAIAGLIYICVCVCMCVCVSGSF